MSLKNKLRAKFADISNKVLKEQLLEGESLEVATLALEKFPGLWRLILFWGGRHVALGLTNSRLLIARQSSILSASVGGLSAAGKWTCNHKNINEISKYEYKRRKLHAKLLIKYNNATTDKYRFATIQIEAADKFVNELEKHINAG
ncbi:MAG: hypothetical protein JSV32_07075 [Dehalococcoidia bacterium]|nr:MAG: hypothetical protein JSV32_07075 [Dehalococcoidia bacterium]